jgi:hypothetical protein
MLFTDEQGKRWEFKGEYHSPKTGEYYLSSYNDPKPCCALADYPSYLSRAIVHLFRDRHIFGGVVFEETGEVREIHPGDFYLWNNDKVYLAHFDGSQAQILRPVALVTSEAESMVTASSANHQHRRSVEGNTGPTGH